MKQYPKVPRYDHPTVSEQFFETGTGWITEKVDGSNLRFALYEDRFAETETWDDDAINIDNNDHETSIQPQPGDIVFGTKTVLRGTTRTPITDLDGNLRRAARALRTIDPDTIRELHDKWGQLVFFAENMILSTLDYDYGDDPPPPLLGFDAYAPDEDSRPPDERHPSDPYADSFEGFLPTTVVYGTETMPGVFEQIDIPTTTAYERDYPLHDFDASSYEIPESIWAQDLTAEGVVIRKDTTHERVKLVTDAFDELNRKRWGESDPADTKTGTEEFVARFCTNARIRSVIRRMLVEDEYEFSRAIINDLYPRVVDDIWEEEWQTIKELDIEFTPSEVPPLVAKRCVEVVRMMETNSTLNDAPAQELWRDQ
jgi:hypothetical protein